MKQNYAGLSRTVNDKTAGDVLTPEKFQGFVDYVNSDEYHQIEMEKMKVRAEGEMFIGRALGQGVISMPEYLKLLESIAFNGFLLVSPKMAKKLEAVKSNE